MLKRALGWLFGKGAFKRGEGINFLLMDSVAYYLAEKYSSEHGEKTAIPLASAVTMELFAREPANEKGVENKTTYKNLIEAKLNDVKNDAKLNEILCINAITRINIAYGVCRVSPEIVLQNAKLTEIGVLPRSKDIKLPNSQDELLQKVQEFDQWVGRQK